MIKFKTVKFKNLLSVGNTFHSFDLDQTPNMLLVGKSGKGKSTLIDAITFGLYGRAYRDINKKQIVNSFNKKGMVVEIEFNNYKVIRGIGPSIFEIYKDGKLLSEKSDVKVQQAYLEKEILKMNFKTFTQIIILGSAAFTPFMKLKASYRRDVIEELLDLHVFAKMNTILKNKISNLREEISTLDAKISTSKESIISIRRIIDSQKDISEDEIQSVQNVIDLKENEIAAKSGDYKRLIAKRNAAEKKVKDFDHNKKNLFQTADLIITLPTGRSFFVGDPSIQD